MTREEATRVLKMLKTECGERAQWVLPLDWGVAFDMAIEALSAEPSDLISRADAMSKCKNAENELTDEAERKGLRVARFIIGELPSADRPSGEWIPCSKRLPSKDGKYLVTFSGFFRGEPSTDIAYYGNPLIPMNSNDNERDWYIAEENGDFYIESVIAWQPLPKPYEAKMKGGGE